LHRDAHDNIKGAQLEDFFINTLLYRKEDYRENRKSFLANLDKVATILNQNCNNKSLKLDLNYSYNSQGNFVSPEQVACGKLNN
jgi:hypothetical protein